MATFYQRDPNCGSFVRSAVIAAGATRERLVKKPKQGPGGTLPQGFAGGGRYRFDLFPEACLVYPEGDGALPDCFAIALQQAASPGFRRVEKSGIRVMDSLTVTEEFTDRFGIDLTHEPTDELTLTSEGLVTRDTARILDSLLQAAG